MKRLITALALLLAAPLAYAEIDEGIEYQAIATPQPTAAEDRIEVLELFWYGCPHCYHLEPELAAWLKNKPDDVAFVRMPAVLGPTWELGARAYYTAELLGVLDKVHQDLFAHIHKAKKPMRTTADLKAFFVGHGVSAQDFDNTFGSFAVITKTNRARQAQRLYGISGVPVLVVNGKYRTTASLAGGNKQMLEVVDQLIVRERGKATAGEPVPAVAN